MLGSFLCLTKIIPIGALLRSGFINLPMYTVFREAVAFPIKITIKTAQRGAESFVQTSAIICETFAMIDPMILLVGRFTASLKTPEVI